MCRAQHHFKKDVSVRCTMKNLELVYGYKHFAALPLVQLKLQNDEI
jgi:hypothetical protein